MLPVVYCDATTDLSEEYAFCERVRVPLTANGVVGIIFDCLAILHCIIRRSDILVLGCSGALMIPVARLAGCKVVTNIAGQEWARSKWGFVARWTLRTLERIAVRCSSVVIADNEYLRWYVSQTYSVDAVFIPYGGDQYLASSAEKVSTVRSSDETSLLRDLPRFYFFAFARCQRDNNLEIILDAFFRMPEANLVLISDFNSAYGKYLDRKYGCAENIFLVDSVYDISLLKTIRIKARAYIHGHSAGGTNPSLVENMFLGKFPLAFNNGFNNSTLQYAGWYWNSADELMSLVRRFEDITVDELNYTSSQIKEKSLEMYTWRKVAEEYLACFETGKGTLT
jgi:glycosyltransferase involved in cell wall biosynthesis